MGFFGLFEPKEIKELKKKRDTDGLLKVLERGDEKIRKHAVKAIRDLGDRKEIELYITRLIKKVETADEKTQLNTIKILKYFDDLAIVPLLKALDSSNEKIQNVCFPTITSLFCGGGLVVNEFEKAFGDESLRKNAGRATAVNYLYVLEEKPSFAGTSKRILEKRAQSNIKIFEELLKDAHPKVVAGAILLMAKSIDKETATKLVKEKFENESLDIEIKKSILKGLYSLGDLGLEIREGLSFRKTVEVEEAIVRSSEFQGELVKNLSSGDAKTRWSAAIQLGMQGDPRSIDVLKEILVHGDAKTRWEVVDSCLEEIKDDRVIELALKALKDEDNEVREKCVHIIDKLQIKDNKVFIKPLIEIINNKREKEDIRHLSSLKLSPSKFDFTNDIKDEEAVIMIVEALKRAEKDESKDVSISAGLSVCHYLNLIVDKKLKISLEDLFEKDQIEEHEKSNKVRELLGKARDDEFIKMHGEDFVQELASLLEDEDEKVRGGALLALEEMSKNTIDLVKPVIPSIISRLGDENCHLRKHAALVLGEIGEKEPVLVKDALHPLKKLMDDTSEIVIIERGKGLRKATLGEVARDVLNKIEDSYK